MIHVEIPEDESYAELGLLEDSFSSVFSEDFQKKKKKKKLQVNLSAVGNGFPIRIDSWACLQSVGRFLVLDARKQGQPFQGPSDAGREAFSLC